MFTLELSLPKKNFLPRKKKTHPTKSVAVMYIIVLTSEILHAW